MFQDIDLAVMLPLALRVITENPGLYSRAAYQPDRQPEATQAG